MNRIKITVGLLVLLGLDSLAILPAMISANRATNGTPPPPAIAVEALIGVLTLVACTGIPAGKRWAKRTAIATRGVEIVSSLLGLGAHPSTLLTVSGAIALPLSVIAIVLLAIPTARSVLV
jgi:hypothetical protein